MKKIIALLLSVAFILGGALSLLTSCGTNVVAPEFTMPEGGFDTESEVTITFYHQMGKALQEILEASIGDFEKLYPNITVEAVKYGDYDDIRDQIKNEITTGDQPNLAYCYPDHIALYNISGAVQTLDVFINSEYGFTAEDIADFVPGFYEEGKAFGDGKMYSLPVSKSTEVLFYNASFFEECQTIYNTEFELNADGTVKTDEDGNQIKNPNYKNENYNIKVPTTWDEMEETCRKIKTIKPDCIPLGYDSEANWFITMCEQYNSGYTSATGEENFLFDNETNKTFVQKLRTWFQNKWVTTEALSGGYTSALFTGEKSTTRCYMCIGSTGGTTYQTPSQTNGKYEFEVGIASIPQVDVNNPKVISQGPSICLFKDEDPQKVLASWLFMKFLATDITFQASVSMNNGYTPVIQSVKDNEIYADFLESYKTDPTANLQAYSVAVALGQSEAYFVSDAFNGSSVARDQVGKLLQACLSQNAADVKAMIDQAFATAISECKYQSGQ